MSRPTVNPKPRGWSSAGTWLIAILVAHVILSAVYWHYTPYAAPPDEGPHGLYVQSLADTHKLPVFDPSDRQHYESHQPPLYYVLGMPFYIVGKALGLTNPAEMIRLLSLILGALSIYIIYRAVRTAFPDEPHLGIAAAGFVALLPTHVMLSSSVSNDVLVELLFGVTLLLSTDLLFNGTSIRRALTLGVVLGLALLTKTTCLILFPVVLLAYLIVWRRGASGGKAVTGHLALALAVSLIIGGWWLVRNNMLYGDPLAMTQFGQAFGHTAKPEYWLSRGFTPTTYGVLVLVWTFCSFWGVFGHMKVFMPTGAYVALAAFSLVIGIAALRKEIELGRKPGQQRDVLLLYNAVLLLVVAAFVGFNARYFQAQGRYLYPALLPIAAFWALGIAKLVPARAARWMPYIAVAIPLAAQIIALATCIVPQMPYYK